MSPAIRVGLICLAGAACLGVGIYLFNPLGLRDAVFSILGAPRAETDRKDSARAGGALGVEPVQTDVGRGSVCEADPQACDFIRAILGSTEEVWSAQFQQGRLPHYFATQGTYEFPVLAVFYGAVDTGCGSQDSDAGPFYCPLDRRIYIDPNFYQVLERGLNAPGDFAQAYIIAHEVGHHVQTLLEVRSVNIAAETANQLTMRRELQADCFAGVWANQKRVQLSIDESDLREGLNAAFALGDDTLTQGQIETFEYTHGTSEQRMRWLQRGFDSGDARECDTFRVAFELL